MNRKVYTLALCLILFAVSVMAVKVMYGKSTVIQKANPHLWRVSIVMNLWGQDGRAKVRLTLPKNNPRQKIYNEHFENAEMVFYIRDRAITGNRVGFWREELLEGFKSIQYTFSTELRPAAYPIPAGLMRPENPKEAYLQEMQVWLSPSDLIQSDRPEVKRQLKKILKREKRLEPSLRKIYDFVRGSVEYRSEKGSKDAVETLNKLVADCGGKARLFAAFSRAAGIPSRIVGGLILKKGTKEITHVWAENYINGQWIPFDAVNDYYAEIPDYYLELYRGDYALIKHVGIKKFEYFFVIGEESVPPLDNPWSLYVLPIHFQDMIKVLLLIPLGALLVAFFRTVIGVPTFGTFTPILLSLAFRQISLHIGLICMFVVILLGWLLRKLLDQMKILVIPRLAIVLTMVVISVLTMMIVGYHLNERQIIYISLFPMVIMTWTVERFSVMEIEDGTMTALKTALGSIVISIFTYWVFDLKVVRTYLFAFPEFLFIIMALLLLMGRYTGIRVFELWRFRDLLRFQREKKNPSK
jgi:hypothetical protein